MRRCYLVCYDIREPRRLRRVHKVMKAFGEPWQYSVFYCTLRALDRVRMEAGLRDEVNLKEDQVLIVDLGSNDEEAREAATFVGIGVLAAQSGTIVL